MSEADRPTKLISTRLRILFAVAALLLLYKLYLVFMLPKEIRGLENVARFAQVGQGMPDDIFPEPKQFSYTVGGHEHAYLCQEASGYAVSKTLLIYIHGSGGTESEGMGDSYSKETFLRMRAEAQSRGWHYIAPRDYEFEGLITDLAQRYQPTQIYFCAQSAGGMEFFYYLIEHPRCCDGVIFACPALSMDVANDPRIALIRMPVMLMAGESEPMIGPVCRRLAANFTYYRANLQFLEYPEGDHCEPFREANWKAVFDFVAGATP